MKYMGSKARIAKYILPIILANRAEGQWYVEPFCGGCNSLDKVGGDRIGCDINEYLIAMFRALGNGWVLPETVSEEEYIRVKQNKDADKALTGYVGFNLTFGAKYFGGYIGHLGDIRNKNRDRIGEGRRSLNRQRPLLDGVIFMAGSYDSFIIPTTSIIYCDPPYANTTKYKDDFNHIKFWQWCRDMAKRGHQIFISEYSAPEDFKCIWQKEIVSSLTKDTGSKTAVEKLFIYAPN